MIKQSQVGGGQKRGDFGQSEGDKYKAYSHNQIHDMHRLHDKLSSRIFAPSSYRTHEPLPYTLTTSSRLRYRARARRCLNSGKRWDGADAPDCRCGLSLFSWTGRCLILHQGARITVSFSASPDRGEIGAV